MFDSHVHDSHGGALPLGQEYLLTDTDHLVAASAAKTGAPPPSGGTPSGGAGSPSSTLVGATSGLQIDLIWDSSVQKASNWQAIEAAVVSAAQIYASLFSNHVVINIAVGFGEVGGSALASNDLGESESLGYLTSYATASGALTAGDAALVHSGLMAANATTSLHALSGETFFITSGEAKALGLVNGSTTAIDGYIGLNSTSLMYFPASGGAIGARQYDAVGVAAHEISEVMGRIGMEGATLGGTKDVYTPLDMFRYTNPGVVDTTPTSGYFSANGGTTNLDTYNNPANGGDAADWATMPSNATNAYDAFDNPGVTTQVTATDLLEVASLGYQVDAGKSLTTVSA
jgi:hypothetical protein